MESRSRGVLDTPLEPVIGLAEGETRWRGMTVFRGTAQARLCLIYKTLTRIARSEAMQVTPHFAALHAGYKQQ
jgi:hypothetical protein